MSSIKELLTKNPSEFTLDDITEMQTIMNRLAGNIPEYYSYDNILRRLLAQVPDNMDKRVSSPIWNALAPVAAEIANEYIEIEIYKDQTYLLTAIGANLDTIGDNYSIPRKQSTYAERILQLTDINDNLVDVTTVPIASRFSVPDSNSTITYSLTRYIEAGKAIITCEQAGVIGNEYTGELLPLFSITTLKEAIIIGTQTPAQDEEDDDTYRNRILEKLNSKAFAGNIRAYKDYIDEISGASEPKVFPVWNGGGTVKLSILDSQYNAISDEFIAEIKELIDPTAYTGQGVGMAPIGHTVTVVTPTEVTINITADIVLESGYDVGTIQGDVEDSIEAYLLQVRKSWVNDTTSYVFINRILACILEVDGVVNAENVLINNDDDNIVMQQTATNQYIPVLGTVVLNAV